MTSPGRPVDGFGSAKAVDLKVVVPTARIRLAELPTTICEFAGAGNVDPGSQSKVAEPGEYGVGDLTPSAVHGQ